MSHIEREKISYTGYLILDLYHNNILSYNEIKNSINNLNIHISGDIIHKSFKWLINIKALKLTLNNKYKITEIGIKRLNTDREIFRLLGI